MPDWVVLLLALSGPVITVVGGFLLVRRFQQLGGGEAQFKVNELRKEIAQDAEAKLKTYEAQLRTRDAEFLDCKGRLERVEADLETERRQSFENRQEIHRLRSIVEEQYGVIEGGIESPKQRGRK